MDKNMSKGDNKKFLNIQTSVLKVNMHCDGCRKKVKKLLHKIEGVYTTSIDSEQGKVTVVGTVDSATLLRKLNKAGKHAEICPTRTSNQNNFQLEHAKGQQKDNGKGQKGGPEGKDYKGHPLQQQHQQLKDLKNLTMPSKNNQNSVKFDDKISDDVSNYSDFSNEFDDDDDDDDDDEYGEDFDDMDGFSDAGLYDDPKMMVKPINNAKQNGNGIMSDRKCGQLPMPNKATGGCDANFDGKHGGVAHDTKSGAKSNNGSAGNSAHNSNPFKMGGGGGKNDGMVGGDFRMGQPNILKPDMRAMNMGHKGHMQAPMGHSGTVPSVQGFPASGTPVTGHFQGGALPQEMLATANPYQQQYMQALLQQQQRMMSSHGLYPQMGYSYGYAPPAYIPQSHSEPYTAFSEDNPNSCSIM